MHIWVMKGKEKGVRKKCPPKVFLLFFLTLTSSASSRTKFMYSSKPCMAQKLTFEQIYIYSLRIVRDAWNLGWSQPFNQNSTFNDRTTSISYFAIFSWNIHPFMNDKYGAIQAIKFHSTAKIRQTPLCIDLRNMENPDPNK